MNRMCQHCALCKRHSVYTKTLYCSKYGDDRYQQDNRTVYPYACACTDFVEKKYQEKINK